MLEHVTCTTESSLVLETHGKSRYKIISQVHIIYRSIGIRQYNKYFLHYIRHNFPTTVEKALIMLAFWSKFHTILYMTYTTIQKIRVSKNFLFSWKNLIFPSSSKAVKMCITKKQIISQKNKKINESKCITLYTKLSDTTVLINTDNKITIYCAANQHSGMISEESCETEDCNMAQ